MLVQGQTIERYIVEDYVGHGASAVVYKVRHAQLGSLHALKVLTIPRADIRERLLAEGRLQARLRHPNVVAVNDVLDVNGSPALLMEYVDGPSLERWLFRQRPSLAEACAIVRAICEGVGEAHHVDIVHRDLKPGNVLLARTSAGFIPKVTDFGIARLLVLPDSEAPTASIGGGTPHYMAPEQVRKADVGPRADVFAIGAILYELVTGERAFLGTDLLSVMNAVAEGRYRPPRELVPDLPDAVVDAITRCLQVAPEARFATPFDVVEALGLDLTERVRITAGLEATDADFETTAVRRARTDWLGAVDAPDGVDEDSTPVRLPHEDDDQVATQLRTRPRFDDSELITEEDTVPPGDTPPDWPRPSNRRSTPNAVTEPTASRVATPRVAGRREVDEPTSVGSDARRLLLTAALGMVLGLAAVALWLWANGWPDQTRPPGNRPQVDLDQVVSPDGGR